MVRVRAQVALGLPGSCCFRLTCCAHSFNKYLYGTFNELDSVLDTGKKAINPHVSAQVQIDSKGGKSDSWCLFNDH